MCVLQQGPRVLTVVPSPPRAQVVTLLTPHQRWSCVARERLSKVRGCVVRERLSKVRVSVVRERLSKLRVCVVRERLSKVRGCVVRERLLKVRGCVVRERLKVRECGGGEVSEGEEGVMREKWSKVRGCVWRGCGEGACVRWKGRRVKGEGG